MFPCLYDIRVQKFMSKFFESFKKFWFFYFEIILLIIFPWLFPYALTAAVIGLVLCVWNERKKKK